MSHLFKKNRCLISVFLVAGSIFLCSCSSDSYLEDADQEVYSIIQDKQRVVLGETESFVIEKGENVEDLEAEARLTYVADDEEAREERAFTGAAKSERPEVDAVEAFLHLDSLPTEPSQEPMRINLDQALGVTFLINRQFQSRKEDLYIEALNLTFQRFLWTPILAAAISGGFTNNELNQRFMTADAGISMNQLLSTGGSITMGIATDLLKFISPDRSESASSLLSFNFFQPLLRGAGSLVAQENLTQAERNVAYEVRAFERFKSSLAVSIATRYYQVLQQKDRVGNELRNYQTLEKNVERSRVMAEAGRLSAVQLDQARQDELSAKNAWILAQASYSEQLDSFKVQMGLPTEVFLELDDRDIEQLSEGGLQHTDLDLEKSLAYALVHRLDLLNERDAVEDAKRRVLVAKDGLGPDLDFNFNYDLGTRDNKPGKFELDQASYSASLNLDLPLNRKNERNAFRQSLITLERQKRNLTLLEDSIKQEVRQSHRDLQLARESYAIQKVALELAGRRVESTNLMFLAKRADQRDLLESQNAFVRAQNNLTSAIVTHTIARMNFFLDIELLSINENGEVSSLEPSDPDSKPAYRRGPKADEKSDDGTSAESGE